MRYFTGIMHTNRKDLLINVLAGLKDCGRLVVMDNSDTQELREFVWENTEIIKPYVPQSFSQAMNTYIGMALRRNLDIMFVAHEDIKINKKAWEEMFALVESFRHRKWGMLLTNEDSFCCYNVKIFQEIKFDTRFPDYFADTDFQYWLKIKGYEVIQTPISIYHYRSQTIESDPVKKMINSYTYPLYQLLYRSKNGGDRGQEKYLTPYDSKIWKW